MKNYTFHISNIHCKACKMLIEDILSEQVDIQNAQVNLKDATLSLESDVTDTKKLIDSLNSQIASYGYEVTQRDSSANGLDTAL